MTQGFGLQQLFGRKKRLTSRIESLIGPQTTVTGDLSFTGGLHVNGRIIGHVTTPEDGSHMLTLASQGTIEGDVRVARIVLDGTVKGDVFASEHIELAANARVYGDVHYRLIEMAMGAEVNGKLVRLSDPNRPQLALGHNPRNPEQPESET